MDPLNRPLIDRRGFIASTTALVASGPLALAAEGRYPYRSLAEAWRACRFDPTAAEAATFAVAADAHYGVCNPEGLRPIVRQINALRPRPEFLLINGDLIHDGSRSFGHRPNADEKRVAIEQFKRFRADMSSLDAEIPLKLTLGNHDTYPGEADPDLFHQVFPGRPAYEAFDCAGVRMIALNGHHEGRLDPRQAEWLHDEAQSLDPSRTICVFVHQPALGQVVQERHIAPAIESVFATHRGPVTLIGGHVHRNGDRVYGLAHTTVAQSSIVCGVDGIWGGPEKPGYWIYGLRDGAVVARVFHRLGHGFRIGDLPDRSDPQKLPRPFEHFPGVRSTVMIGEGDEAFRVKIEAADAETFLAYTRRATYRLPPPGAIAANQVAVLGHLPADPDQPDRRPRVSLSADGTTWHNVEMQQRPGSVWSANIPKPARGDELFVDIQDERGQSTIGGFALA